MNDSIFLSKSVSPVNPQPTSLVRAENDYLPSFSIFHARIPHPNNLQDQFALRAINQFIPQIIELRPSLRINPSRQKPSLIKVLWPDKQLAMTERISFNPCTHTHGHREGEREGEQSRTPLGYILFDGLSMLRVNRKLIVQCC